MIFVTGANGQLGSAVVEQLLKRKEPPEIRAGVRDLRWAGRFESRGVNVRCADYDHPPTLDGAFQGVQKLLLISSSGIGRDRRVTQHCNVIDAAVRCGVEHVYYTSLIPGPSSLAHVARAHQDTEAYLRGSGLTYTILRNSAYTEALGLYAGDLLHGDAKIPADGPVSWVSRDDLAEGIATLLTERGHHDETLRLTGSMALDINTVATVAGLLLGRRVRRQIVPLDEFIQEQIRLGNSAHFARLWSTTYFGMAQGEFAAVDPLLERILGRPLRGVDTVLANFFFEAALR